MNENKVPCGGFRIGDGLTMEGDMLKSLGGAYVKVKVNINDNDEPTLEFMDDSPLKTFEEIRQKTKTSIVMLQLHFPDKVRYLFYNDCTDISIRFYDLRVINNQLTESQTLITSDNKIITSVSQYTLTPAT